MVCIEAHLSFALKKTPVAVAVSTNLFLNFHFSFVSCNTIFTMILTPLQRDGGDLECSRHFADTLPAPSLKGWSCLKSAGVPCN